MVKFNLVQGFAGMWACQPLGTHRFIHVAVAMTRPQPPSWQVRLPSEMRPLCRSLVPAQEKNTQPDMQSDP